MRREPKRACGVTKDLKRMRANRVQKRVQDSKLIVAMNALIQERNQQDVSGLMHRSPELVHILPLAVGESRE